LVRGGKIARMDDPDREPAPVFASPVTRGALIGGAVGLAIFLALLVAIGRPDSYSAKLLILAGGGAAVGAFIGMFFRKPQAPRG
jgi:hypothetical protein